MKLSVFAGEGVDCVYNNEYTPVNMVLQILYITQQRSAMLSTIEQREKTLKTLIAFPGEEDLFGGCLSAGRDLFL
jgi:hypothetical protein